MSIAGPSAFPEPSEDFTQDLEETPLELAYELGQQTNNNNKALPDTQQMAGKERSVVWKANQFLLVHTFHLRSVVEYLFWYIYQNWSHIWAHMLLSVFLALYVQLTLVSLMMTPYWTYKKTAQMINPVDWNFESKREGADVSACLNGFTNTELKKSV
nr:hypothetical protein BaRGS_033166 [Batillaria attramentaria]